MERRDLVKLLGVSAAAPAVASCTAPKTDAPAAPPERGPAGTASDPDLLRPRVSWPKVLTPTELATLTALCDLIIPADAQSPSASQVGVPDYLNEWASAPYEYQQGALVKIRAGLTWLDTEGGKRFGKPFAGLTPVQQAKIADDICYLPRAKPAYRTAAEFFDLIRDLTATGFYTTAEGMRDLGYIGNVALPQYDGPPAEVLRHLGL
jgi:hypothetical protein